MKHFNQFADSLDVSFECPQCHKIVTHQIDDIISPDWEGDTVASTTNYDDDEFCCGYCGHVFEIDIFVNIEDGEIVVTDTDTGQEIENLKIQEHYMTDEEFEKSLL